MKIFDNEKDLIAFKKKREEEKKILARICITVKLAIVLVGCTIVYFHDINWFSFFFGVLTYVLLDSVSCFETGRNFERDMYIRAMTPEEFDEYISDEDEDKDENSK